MQIVAILSNALAVAAITGEDQVTDANASLQPEHTNKSYHAIRLAGEGPETVYSLKLVTGLPKPKTCTKSSETVNIAGEDPIKGSNVSKKKTHHKTSETAISVTLPGTPLPTSVRIITTISPPPSTVATLTTMTNVAQSTAGVEVLPPPTTILSTTTTLQQTPLPLNSLPPRALDTCYDYTMNVQKGKAPSSCGAAFYRISYCYNDTTPWTDLYDSDQNEAFRDCACMTGPEQPFDEKTNDMYKFWAGCLRCVSAANDVDGDEVSLIIDQIPLLDNFCRAEQPDRYLFVSSLSSFFSSVDATTSITVSPLADVTPVISSLSSLYTTTPPLANLAYVTNASPNGSLAGVTPSLTTFTSGADTITSLVTWVPTDGGTYDPVAASKSAESAALSALSASWAKETHGSQPTACYGRGPCHGAGVGRTVPMLGFVVGMLGLVVGGVLLAV